MKFLKSLFNKEPQIPKVDLAKRFHLIGRVGQGSMSKVWRAQDLLSGKMVALKVLDREKTLRLESRFVGLNRPNEGEIATTLIHRNIVRTLECGISTDDTQFLVMEFVEGVSLSYLIDMQNKTMRNNRLRFILELGDALHYFHKQNWIHRDICPRNVLLDSDYCIKLIDFGLAVPNTEPFRKPGNRTGTVSYMAPELIKRQKTDQRIDIFSFASSCYEIYTQQLPWDHSGVSLEMVLQHINRPPVDIRTLDPTIDEQIAETIMKGLAQQPGDRISTMAEMLKPLWEAHKRLEGETDDKYLFLIGQADQAAVPARMPSHIVINEQNADDDLPDRVLFNAGNRADVEVDDEYEDVSDLIVEQDAEEAEIDLDKYFEVEDDDDDEYETV